MKLLETLQVLLVLSGMVFIAFGAAVNDSDMTLRGVGMIAMALGYEIYRERTRGR